MVRKVLLALFFLALTRLGYAQDITIIYSGETHAMLYPCNCPIEPDGGVSRRATLIKNIRKDTPDALVVDSGAFFAGGLMDEYTQNTELDMRRSLVSLKAMELMGYDAVDIGDDEFNFGSRFLEENIAKTNLHFVSANIKSAGVSPYIIKETKGIKIGIIGVTSVLSRQKAEGVQVSDPRQTVRQAISELKGKGAGLILLLSHLGEAEDLKLIQDVEGIDVIVEGQSRLKEEISTKIGKTIIVRPAWQGRRLGRLSLTVTDKGISGYNTDELRLSNKISDDPDIQNILPKCFSDANCKKEGLNGVCNNPGATQAACVFTQPQKVNALIIVPKDCNICDPQRVIRNLKSYFPGLISTYSYYPDAQSEKLIKELDLKFLPAYLLGREIEKEKGFDDIKGDLSLKGKFYIVKAHFSGMSYLLDRKNLKNKLDVMLSLYDKNAAELLQTIKEFKPNIHFLAVEKDGNFDAAKGKAEVEEYERAVCVQKYYPDRFFDYISCRAQNINSSWWEDCLGESDTAKIRACARSQEASELLRQNLIINKELGVMFGPTYLVDNREIFSTQGGVPKKEEFKKLFNRK